MLNTPDFTGCYFGCDDSEHGRLYDCRTYPSRYVARRAYASDLGEPLRDFRATVIYARWITRAEKWDDFGRDRWRYEFEDEDLPECPKCGAPAGKPCNAPIEAIADEPCDERLELDETPQNWEPFDEDPTWAICKRMHPDAVRCWYVEWTG